jgi:hypothetical protein
VEAEAWERRKRKCHQLEALRSNTPLVVPKEVECHQDHDSATAAIVPPRHLAKRRNKTALKLQEEKAASKGNWVAAWLWGY